MSSVCFEKGSFPELIETEMYSNVTEMGATIETDASQNTNSLISSGYFIENYSGDDSDKENNSTSNIDDISEDKVKTLA